MTIRDFISQKMQAFGITEAHYAELGLTINLDDEYTFESASQVGVAMCGMIEELLFSPRQSNINEQGFSVSWDFGNLGKYYWWLCRRYGVKPNAEVLAACGISMIRDCTSRW